MPTLDPRENPFSQASTSSILPHTLTNKRELMYFMCYCYRAQVVAGSQPSYTYLPHLSRKFGYKIIAGGFRPDL